MQASFTFSFSFLFFSHFSPFLASKIQIIGEKILFWATSAAVNIDSPKDAPSPAFPLPGKHPAKGPRPSPVFPVWLHQNRRTDPATGLGRGQKSPWQIQPWVDRTPKGPWLFSEKCEEPSRQRSITRGAPRAALSQIEEPLTGRQCICLIVSVHLLYVLYRSQVLNYTNAYLNVSVQKNYTCAALEHVPHCLRHGEALRCRRLSRTGSSYRLTCGFGVTGRSWLRSPYASSPPSHAPHSGCGIEICFSWPSSDQGILQASCIFPHRSYKWYSRRPVFLHVFID